MPAARRRGPHINAHALVGMRIARGFTQLRLAEAARLDSSFISRLERGERRYPRADRLAAIAQALDVPMSALVLGTDVPEVPEPPELVAAS